MENFKNDIICSGVSGQGHYWELSNEVLDRIESDNYMLNKEKHNVYLKSNPFVAKKKFINIH